MKYKIKLQPGDYCRRNMGEDKYRECAQRFLDDGCPEYEGFGWPEFTYFGWDSGGLYHSQHANNFGGRLLTYEQIMEKADQPEIENTVNIFGGGQGGGINAVKNDSWYEKGELPPVGWHGETTWGGKVAWHECVILPDKKMAVKNKFGEEWYSRPIDNSYEFRPIKSDREKAIEDMAKIFFDAQMGNANDISFGALYDAGYRKADK